jgi:hypothetical protein
LAKELLLFLPHPVKAFNVGGPFLKPQDQNDLFDELEHGYTGRCIEKRIVDGFKKIKAQQK